MDYNEKEGYNEKEAKRENNIEKVYRKLQEKWCGKLLRKEREKIRERDKKGKGKKVQELWCKISLKYFMHENKCKKSIKIKYV